MFKVANDLEGGSSFDVERINDCISEEPEHYQRNLREARIEQTVSRYIERSNWMDVRR